MANPTTTEIISDAVKLLQDDSEALRAKLLSYLNEACQALLIERDWQFLQKTATITIVDGIIPTPIDYERMTEIAGDGFVMTGNDKISASEALHSHAKRKVVEVATGLQIVPATTGSVEMTYVQAVPQYADGEVTLFPAKARAYLKRYILTMYYEYDVDERWATSVSQLTQELFALKRWDNQLKPLPQIDRRGLRR